MSEQNGSADGPKLSFTAGAEKYIMRPDNAEVHRYSEVPETDHFIVRQRRIATRAFRKIFPMFDEWAAFMEENGYPVVEAAYPDDKTFMSYRNHHGEPDLHIRELTPRQDRHIEFNGWLLDMDIVTIQHFMKTRNEAA